eukprot:TRINITY_DN48008_c0_g1_i1.p1 TRINITY_DN48008_c0_g1~~TRINITY_DN48008_c0_g1_i1.p1  ORF type:complete len:173 (+),score=50.76 TRINITY_DN48008_c0_g1_i1:47-520(+)
MSFLNEIKARSDLRAKGLAAEVGDVDPNTVKDRPWVTELDVEKYVGCGNGGKWLLHCDKGDDLRDTWQRCRELYHSGAIEGVSNMKVSTGHPRYASWRQGVIVLYCTDGEEEALRIGRIILNHLNYNPPSGKMYFKTDDQTTGAAPGDHLYWLPTSE